MGNCNDSGVYDWLLLCKHRPGITLRILACSRRLVEAPSVSPPDMAPFNNALDPSLGTDMPPFSSFLNDS